MWGKELGKWLAEDTTALWSDHSTFILGTLLLLYGRIFDSHRNGIIYAVLPEGKNNNANNNNRLGASETKWGTSTVARVLYRSWC